MCMKWFVLEALFATHDSKSALETLMTSLSHPCSAKTGAQLDMTNQNTSTEHGFLCPAPFKDEGETSGCAGARLQVAL